MCDVSSYLHLLSYHQVVLMQLHFLSQIDSYTQLLVVCETDQYMYLSLVKEHSLTKEHPSPTFGPFSRIGLLE